MSAARTTVNYAEQMEARRRAAAAAAAAPVQINAPQIVEPAPVATREEAPIGVTADRPIAVPQTIAVAPLPATAPVPVAAAKKAKRQGIDLREADQERIYCFDVFCLRSRLKTGKKMGLTLYARAGFELLDRMMKSNPEAAKDLLRAVAEEKA